MNLYKKVFYKDDPKCRGLEVEYIKVSPADLAALNLNALSVLTELLHLYGSISPTIQVTVQSILQRIADLESRFALKPEENEILVKARAWELFEKVVGEDKFPDDWKKDRVEAIIRHCPNQARAALAEKGGKSEVKSEED